MIKGQFTDANILIDSLNLNGIRAIVGQGGELIKARTYDGYVKDCQIVCRKNSNSSVLHYADIGFKKGVDGTYDMHIDELDKENFPLSKVMQDYTRLKIENNVKNNYPTALISSENKENKIFMKIQL